MALAKQSNHSVEPAAHQRLPESFQRVRLSSRRGDQPARRSCGTGPDATRGPVSRLLCRGSIGHSYLDGGGPSARLTVAAVIAIQFSEVATWATRTTLCCARCAIAPR